MSLVSLLAEAAQAAGNVTHHVMPAAQSSNAFEQITLGNVAGAASVLVGGFMLWLNLDKRRRETAKEAADGTDRIIAQMTKVSGTFDTRVDRLEQRSADFMPKNEILSAIKHVDTHSSQMALVMGARMEKSDAAIIELRVALGKVEEAHRNLDDDVSEIKNILKDQRREQNERLDRQDGKLDRLQDSLNALARKAP